MLTLPDPLAWLLNILGRDLLYIPVPWAFAVLHDDASVDLFIAEKGFGETAALFDGDVSVHTRQHFIKRVSSLKGPVCLDQAIVPNAVASALNEAGIDIHEVINPCVKPK